jgi:striatin 1/3/4
LRLQ